MFIIAFFRDMSGIWYILWVLLMIFFQLVLVGYIGDRKIAVIHADLAAKRKYDIESGKVAEEAAMASKQNLSVMTEEQLKEGREPETEPEKKKKKKEEVPQTLIIGADGKQQK